MKNRLAIQRIYWIKPKVQIVEEIKDIDVALNLQEEYLAENPSGKGRVFKKQELIAEVVYELRIFQDNTRGKDKPVVMGKIKRVDNINRPWGIEQYTLHLQDNRKLDFVCVDYNPDCEIVSDKGFYL